MGTKKQPVQGTAPPPPHQLVKVASACIIDSDFIYIFIFKGQFSRFLKPSVENDALRR